MCVKPYPPLTSAVCVEEHPQEIDELVQKGHFALPGFPRGLPIQLLPLKQALHEPWGGARAGQPRARPLDHSQENVMDEAEGGLEEEFLGESGLGEEGLQHLRRALHFARGPTLLG